MMDFHVLSTLGMLLGFSLAAGVLAEIVHLPKVTAYLIVGLTVGPSLLDLIPHDQVEVFHPMIRLAMALVLFNLGCRFSFRRIRPILWRVTAISIGEAIVTITVVSVAIIYFGAGWQTGLLLGCLAVATAPATTILVIQELESEGPVTDCTASLVAANNFICIIAFEIAFLFIHLVDGGNKVPLTNEIGFLLRDILGSFALGILGGLILSFACGLLHLGWWLVLLTATTTFLLGICETYELPYMLTFLMMGAMVANCSDNAGKMSDELDHLTGLLCVLFFTVHGTEMKLGSFVAAGMLGATYIISRVVGKYSGVYLAALVTKQPEVIRRWVGGCMLSQAGAAIALASIAVTRDPELGANIQVIILGSVVAFEIAGPLLIRQSLVRAGEVPLSHVIHHTSKTVSTQIQELMDRILALMGRGKASDPNSIQVTDLCKPIKPLDEAASFDQVVAYIEHSHDNTYPIVNQEQGLVGVIRYPLLSDVMFNQTANRLIRAADLASPVEYQLFPEDPVSRAIELFQQGADDCIPVVQPEAPYQLLGVLRRSDLMHTLISFHRAV